MDVDDFGGGGLGEVNSSPSGCAAVVEDAEKEEDSSAAGRGDGDGDAEGEGWPRVERGRDGASTDTARTRRGERGEGGGVCA